MKTIHMRHLLPLAAIALIAAACDPFPAKPGGDPRVVRVSTHDADWTGNAVTVENTGASPGTVTLSGAYPLDTIYVAFNKPMNGLTLQASREYDDNGNKLSPVYSKPANLTTTGFGPGTTFRYYPGSVSDGAQVIITPDAAMVFGTSYTVTGTVQDYEGKSLAINITVTVDPSVTATAVDGLAHPGYGVSYAYGLMVDWFPTGALSYTLEWALDAATPVWSAPIAIDPATACGPAYDFNVAATTPIGYDVCEYLLPELPPSTDYLIRVGEGAAPTVWNETAASTRGPLPVTLTNFAATGSAVTIPGAVQLAWGRVLPATSWTRSGNVVQPAWVVERAPEVDGAPGTWADITATLSTTASTATTPVARLTTSTSRSAVDLTATPGTAYYYRVRPAFATNVYNGAAGRKVAFGP